MIVGVILAAGRSERMGQPKALLKLHGDTFLFRIRKMLCDSAIHKCVIAVAQDSHSYLSHKDLSGGEVVQNADSSAGGQNGSVIASIRMIVNRPVEAIVVCPVDCPAVSVSTVRSIVWAFIRGRHPVVVPRSGTRRGHPVLFSRSVFTELIEAGNRGAKAVVRANPARLHEVPVNDTGVLDDNDTPEQYRELLRRFGGS